MRDTGMGAHRAVSRPGALRAGRREISRGSLTYRAEIAHAHRSRSSLARIRLPGTHRIRKAVWLGGSAWEKAMTKSDSAGPPAPSSSALPSTFLECASEGVVAIDESQKIVAFGGGAER